MHTTVVSGGEWRSVISSFPGRFISLWLAPQVAVPLYSAQVRMENISGYPEFPTRHWSRLIDMGKLLLLLFWLFCPPSTCTVYRIRGQKFFLGVTLHWTAPCPASQPLMFLEAKIQLINAKRSSAFLGQNQPTVLVAECRAHNARRGEERRTRDLGSGLFIPFNGPSSRRKMGFSPASPARRHMPHCSTRDDPLFVGTWDGILVAVRF